MPGASEAVELSLPDDELMRRLAEGNAAALGTLYLRHAASIRTFLHRVLREESAAEASDLCQEVFLTAWQGASHYRERGKARAWLLGIAARKAQGYVRKSRGRRTLVRLFAPAPAPAHPAHDEAGASDGTGRERVGLALQALSHDQRVVLLLHIVDGMPAADIAAALRIRPKTVWTRLHRARLAMRQALDIHDDRSYRRQP